MNVLHHALLRCTAPDSRCTNVLCQKSSFNIVKVLIDAGVDYDLPDKFGWTPLFYAISSDIDMKHIYPLLNSTINWNHRTDHNETYLMRAVVSNNIPMIEYLLDNDVIDVNAVNNEGWSALYYAIRPGFKQDEAG